MIGVEEVHHVCFFLFSNHLRSDALEHLRNTLVSYPFIHVIVDESSYFLDDVVVLFPFTCLWFWFWFFRKRAILRILFMSRSWQNGYSWRRTRTVVDLLRWIRMLIWIQKLKVAKVAVRGSATQRVNIVEVLEFIV